MSDERFDVRRRPGRALFALSLEEPPADLRAAILKRRSTLRRRSSRSRPGAGLRADARIRSPRASARRSSHGCASRCSPTATSRERSRDSIGAFVHVLGEPATLAVARARRGERRRRRSSRTALPKRSGSAASKRVSGADRARLQDARRRGRRADLARPPARARARRLRGRDRRRRARAASRRRSRSPISSSSI